MKEFSSGNIMLAVIGCLCLFLLPIFGILALWSFDVDAIRTEFNDLFGMKNSDYDYNFQVDAGEDAILTSRLVQQANSEEIIQVTNPAVFVKIDSASIEGPIVYGHNGEELLRSGFWHLPGTSLPGENGIAAIFGHRRYHLPPAKDTFFNLDKVGVGDRVEMKLQDGTWLEYTVTKIDIINPDQISTVTSKQTEDPLVKFITCTPLGTDRQRLVVTAKKTF